MAEKFSSGFVKRLQQTEREAARLRRQVETMRKGLFAHAKVQGQGRDKLLKLGRYRVRLKWCKGSVSWKAMFVSVKGAAAAAKVKPPKVQRLEISTT